MTLPTSGSDLVTLDAEKFARQLWTNSRSIFAAEVGNTRQRKAVARLLSKETQALLRDEKVSQAIDELPANGTAQTVVVLASGQRVRVRRLDSPAAEEK